MSNISFLKENYKPSDIDLIEVRGSGEDYENIINHLEQIEDDLGINYIESDEPSTYTTGVRMDVITDSGIYVLLRGDEIKKISIREALES
ncbi:MAG: hypothetical protein ACI8Z7_000769 [Candidatus Nanohaloarchaea archaeon]|jgi:hypothetical protein